VQIKLFYDRYSYDCDVYLYHEKKNYDYSIH